MPLPDALPDKRIYELLKTVDLENLSFADFQGVAKTIYAEQGAEDELRRIILVNLARLSVKGEWNGLTTAASGGSTPTYGIPSGISGSSIGTTQSRVGQGYAGLSSSARNLSDYDTPGAFPIIAQASGNVSSLTVHCNASEAGVNALVGFYTDNNGSPDSLMGFGTFSMGSTGYVTQTSFSATITLEAGKAYWLVFGNDDNSTSTAGLRRLSDLVGFGIVEDNSYEYPWAGWAHSGATTSLPATFTASAGRFFRPLAYYSVS